MGVFFFKFIIIVCLLILFIHRLPRLKSPAGKGGGGRVKGGRLPQEETRTREGGRREPWRTRRKPRAGSPVTSLSPAPLSLFFALLCRCLARDRRGGEAAAKEFQTSGPQRSQARGDRPPIVRPPPPGRASILLGGWSLLCANERPFPAWLHNVCVLAGQRSGLRGGGGVRASEQEVSPPPPPPAAAVF